MAYNYIADQQQATADLFNCCKVRRLKQLFYKGESYFIDLRLKEFRNTTTADPINFFSDIGDIILAKAIKKNLVSQDELINIFETAEAY